MNILIVSCVFPPEPVVSARLSRDLQHYLRAQGHEVKVVCPIPSRGVDQAAAESATGRDEAVVRLDAYRSPKSDLLARARESWDFGRRTATWLNASPSPRWDVIYGNVWPLLSQRALVRAAARRRTPVVLHVQDVYPEALATKLPPWAYRIVAPPFVAFDSATTRQCAAVVLISERIRRQYAASRRIAERAYVVRNWVDDTPFAVEHPRHEACAEYRVAPRLFTFLYLGNISPLANLETAIRAFAAARIADAQFVIVGEGSAKAACQALVRDRAIPNVHFRSEPDSAKVARVQAMADAFVLPMRPGGAATSTPSKCISYLLSARPIVAAVDIESDVADDLRRAGAAWFCPPGDEARLAQTLREAVTTPTERRATMGAAGRSYARREFSREVCLPRLAAILEAVAANRPIPQMP
jgi:glycosyltransferase involved in cell wall biosynthesis